jgi:GGDEF domain-containing protein
VLFDASATVAKTVLQEIVTSFEQPRHARLHVTVSVGIASFPAFDGPGPLLDAANRALARAKDRVSESVIEIEEAEPS